MMSIVELNHFSHEHPLVLADETGKEVECYGCKKSISGSVYSCGECDYFLHKKCAQLPVEIQYPMHNKHALTLYKTPTYWSMSCQCNVCLHKDRKAFTYNCKICQFDVDILCVLNEGTIEHKGHHHPLTLLLNEATFACHACATESEKEQSYLCTKCQFWIHKSCALSPTTITHTDHPDHPLALGFSLPYENRSFTYFCEIWEGKMHSPDWLYYCDKCRYFLHIKCANTTRVYKGNIIADDTETIIRFPLSAEESIMLLSQLLNEVSLVGDETEPEINHFSHRCSLFLLDDQSRSISTDDLINLFRQVLNEVSLVGDKTEPEIDHFSHDCSLSLLHEQSRSISTDDEEVVICNCCIQPITTTPYYGCIQCNYFLHKSCTYLPEELKHPCHPDHLLNLYAPQSLIHNFKCNSCERYGNGFYYCCETCNYYLDISCAYFPNIIKHQGHNHPMHISEGNEDFICDACGFPCKESTFICDGCDYRVDISCAGFPPTFKHDWVDEPLLLSYPPYSDHPGYFICEVCEEEMHPKRWAYRSHCGLLFFHLYCVSLTYDYYSKIKFGGSLTVENHPHPLMFVPKSKNKTPSLCNICHVEDKEWPILECAPCNFVIHRICYLYTI